MTLGHRLKKAREGKRFTQLEVAKKLGISNGTLSGYERNYRDPDTDTLTRMANLYEVSLNWLLGKEETKIENAAALPKSKLDLAVEQIEKDFDITITDDPDIMEALESYLRTLGKMKKK